MKPQEIKIDDWMRILIGEVPVSFFLELIIRAIIIYIILIFAMRSMGKRMSSQLSRNELGALVSLAAAIGVPMMAPDRGILPAIVIAIVLVAIQRVIAKWAFKSQDFEKFSQGNISMLVKNSVIEVNELGKIGLSRERLVAQLRSGGVKQLGQVKRMYIEANGSFTLIENDKTVPGLSIIPEIDADYLAELTADDKNIVCCFCGQPIENKSSMICPNCGKNEWTAAVND